MKLFFYVSIISCTFFQTFTSHKGEGYKTFTKNGGWCWFQDPRAVYINGNKKRTYAGWMTNSGQLQIGYYDHESDTIKKITLKESWDIDDHNNNSFLVLTDNRLTVFYAKHNKHGLFCKTASIAENISKWENEVTISDSDHITYSHPCYLTRIR